MNAHTSAAQDFSFDEDTPIDVSSIPILPEVESKYGRLKHTLKFVWWYDSIIDLMLADPTLTKKQIAAQLGCTPQAIYLITGSDSFRLHFAQRRANHNATLSDTLNKELVSRLHEVAIRGLDTMLERYEENPASINIQTAREDAEMALQRLGYGRPAAGTQVNVSAAPGSQVAVVTASPDAFEKARSRIRSLEKLQRPELRVIEGNAEEVESVAPAPA